VLLLTGCIAFWYRIELVNLNTVMLMCVETWLDLVELYRYCELCRKGMSSEWTEEPFETVHVQFTLL